MKAARIDAYKADVTVENATQPRPGHAEVLVRVAAAALNPLDAKMRQGIMHDFFPVKFPYTLGTDLAGTIEKAGAGARDWHVGDEVVARTDPTAGGALAAFSVVPTTHLARLPTGLTLETAAGLPTTAGTAWQALFEIANLRRGQTILIHAGAGGIGSFAIQMARNIGARVVATASGDGVETVRQLGADQVIDYRTQAFEEAVSDVDIVLDTIGGETQQRSFGVLRAGGLLASTVTPPDEAMAKAHAVRATFVFHQSDAARLSRLLDLAASGELELLVDRIAPFNELIGSFARLESSRARGKIIVRMGNDRA